MFSRLVGYLENKERAWRGSFGNDISTPVARQSSWRHFLWVDHGFLRVWWTNFHTVAEGVFRSNQPSPERLKSYAGRGIRAVLNLRGTSLYSYYLFEREACEELAIELTDIYFSATALPTLETLLELESSFRTLPKPFVMHCKSGADRAGFVAALYLLLIEGEPIEIAQRQLSFRYLHIKASKKGILDFCLETYRQTNEVSPIPFRDWMLTMYDPEVITSDFIAQRAGKGA
jgi:protein tyrosine/serine phosphatase